MTIEERLDRLKKQVDVHTPKANVQCTTLDRKPLKSVRNRHQTNTILNTLHEPKSTTVLELKYRSYEMFTIIQEFTEKYRGFRGSLFSIHPLSGCERLQKQSARWRAAAICLGVCLLLVTGLGAAAFQDRSRMTLEDNAGRMRISLQIHPDFGPMISLFDNEDKERLRIGSDQNANGKLFVWMFDKQFNRVKTIEP